jgi:hypothetical protein
VKETPESTNLHVSLPRVVPRGVNLCPLITFDFSLQAPDHPRLGEGVNYRANASNERRVRPSFF